MRVGSVSAYSYPKIKKNQNANSYRYNQSFKADVRIVESEIFNEECLPRNHAENMVKVLAYAKNAYKDLGNDNMLLILTPFTNNAKWKRNITSDISITYGYKDPEKARLDLIEHYKDWKKNGKYSYLVPKVLIDEYINDLEERNPNAMNDVKRFSRVGNQLHPGLFGQPKGIKMITKEILDENMKFAVENLMSRGDSSEEQFFGWYEDRALDSYKVDKFLRDLVF